MEKTETWSKPEVYTDGDKKYEVSFRIDQETGYFYKKIILFDADGVGIEIFWAKYSGKEVYECLARLHFGLV